MNKKILLIFIIILVYVPNILAQNKYVGLKSCISCHKGEKNNLVYENWLKTKHASAYKTLETPKAQEIAKKLKLTNPPTESIECLKCHSTGYFEGEQSMPTNKKEDGVTCEACHGPGSAYKNSHGKGKKEEGIKKGLVLGTNDEKLCKKCHNPQSPTYAGFDYKKDWEKIKH